MSSDSSSNPESSQILVDLAYREINFPSLRLTHSSRVARRFAKVLLICLFFSVLGMFFLPWRQSIKGDGAVVAFNPVNREQDVMSPVKGIIAEIGEGIRENAHVKKGQLVYRIVDTDPNYLPRLQQQVANTNQQLAAVELRLERIQSQIVFNQGVVNAKQNEISAHQEAQREALNAAQAYILMAENKLAAEEAGRQAAEDTVWQTDLDYQRKGQLAEKGWTAVAKYQEVDLKYRQAKAKLEQAEKYVEAARNEVAAKTNDREVKRQEYEGKIRKAEGELKKASSDIAKAQGDLEKAKEEQAKYLSELAKIETSVARQETQVVRAPRTGNIKRLLAYTKSALVKQGDTLFTIVPELDEPAVEITVAGNDAPLIDPGRHVRLQFEGWPAVQFSGWPSVAVGTFGGTVALVDPSDDGTGAFRIVVVPDKTDEAWPKAPYLRQGGRAHGWVLLNQVPLGYEIWRRMNGFPPSLKSKDEKPKGGKKPKVPKVKV